jgi:hypothetical protein
MTKQSKTVNADSDVAEEYFALALSIYASRSVKDVPGKIRHAYKAVRLGKLTKKQFEAFRFLLEEDNWLPNPHIVTFISKQEIPDDNVSPYRLSIKLAAGEFESNDAPYQLTLEICVFIADNIRETDCPSDEKPSTHNSPGEWVSQDEFLYMTGYELSSLRTARNSGRKAPDGLSGIDTMGNVWRKKGNKKTESPEYFYQYGVTRHSTKNNPHVQNDL